MIENIARLFFKDYKHNRPGFAVAVINKGKVIVEQYLGLANLDFDVPITSRTTFRIAALSKQFIAMCIQLLDEECVISLTDSIREYIPELPNYADDITLYHLLYHTSGLRDYSFLLWGLAGVPRSDRVTEEELLELIIRQDAPSFEPGTDFRYSNTGYFLLSLVIKRATGMSLAEFSKENIFKRLNMNNTHFHDDWTQVVKNRATGYSVEKKNKFHIYDMLCTGLVGDDGIFTNVTDWVLWDQNFYGNKLTKRKQILTRRTFEPGHLDTGAEVPYAAGLFFKRYRGQKAYYHHGNFLGFKSYYIIYPELEFSVVAMGNFAQFDAKNVCLQIEDMFLDDIFGEEEERSPKYLESEENERLNKDVDFETKEMNLPEEYIGEYYSEELETTYLVEIESNKLILKNKNIHRRTTKEFLMFIGEDRFLARFWKWKVVIKFIREDKEISGFQIVDVGEQIQPHKFAKIS